jgi:hypothetical protein
LCNIIFFNVYTSCEDKSVDVKESFHEELESVFDHFPTYDINILLNHINEKLGREDTFKPTFGNESPHEISDGNGVRAVNFVTSTNLVVKSTMFPHRSIHKYTWTSPGVKTPKEFDHVLLDRRRHASTLDVRSF